MDSVFIRELRIEAVIGIYEWERRARQTLVFDIEMAADTARAAASGNIADALDYHAVCVRLDEFVVTGRFELLETLAERCAELLMREFRVPWLRLRVAKPTAVAAAAAVGIQIERGARPA